MKDWRKFRRNWNWNDRKNQLKKELLESRKLSDKFSKNHLIHWAENSMQGIYLGYFYSRYRKIRKLDKYDIWPIRKYMSNAIIIQWFWEENTIIVVVKGIYIDFESMKTPLTPSDTKKIRRGWDSNPRIVSY